MKAEKLAGLQPERVFAHFEKICSIPHGTYHCKAICDYLVSFAEQHGLHYIRDNANNLIVFKPASAGYEEHAPVILQGHMDMVCQKEEGVCIDMQTQPIDVTHDGQYVYAKGTTLGADDGDSIAMILSILEDETAAHPPLEIVITADEEVGLSGANAIDLGMLKGRRMINLDTHNDKVMNAGCGGGALVRLEMPVEREGFNGARLRISIEGLQGGHSGNMIDKKLANANKKMAELLLQIQALTPIRLESLNGGIAGNVIPGTAQAIIACDAAFHQQINVLCNSFAKQIRAEYDEPNAVVMTAVLPTSESLVLSPKQSAQALTVIHDLPNGVQKWSPDFKELPLLSLNLGVVELTDKLVLLTNLRSGVNRIRQGLQDTLKAFAEKYGCEYNESGMYSAWEYRKDSPLRETLLRIYQEHYSALPIVRVIHAGLECGVLSEKIPELDCVSMGPTAYDIHTTRERMDIASVGKFYAFLKDALAAM